MADRSTNRTEEDDTPLPSWLATHVNIEWNSDDVDALLTSIDASQSPEVPTLPHLPAELLLHIIEFVPIGHVLDWRLVCRGFRDAIDGRVLYHHLQRIQLVGYLGARKSQNMNILSDGAYEQLHLLRANFHSVKRVQSESARPGPLWTSKHAVFQMDERWFESYRYRRASSWNSHREFPTRENMLERLKIRHTGRGFGTLIWAIGLDNAVLDIDLALEPGRNVCEVSVDLEERTVQVDWKQMLFRFLKTESAFRRLLEKKTNAAFTFSHAEDCLRTIRRQGMHAALDPDNKIDRHIKWSLRLLQPLFGNPSHSDLSTLGDVETEAVGVLLLLRRKAALTKRQIQHLHQLASDYRAMTAAMTDLSGSMEELKAQMVLPGTNTSIQLPVPMKVKIPRDPIAWPDTLRSDIEVRVQKWRAQRSLIEQMQVLLNTSLETFALPEDAFDTDALDTEHDNVQ